jgi:replicative DNA helicase
VASLYNLELEKTFLSGTILNISSRAETGYIQPSDLSTTNRVVLAAIDACIGSGTEFSVFLLADRLNSLGIKIGDAIEPGIYIKSLEGLAVGDKAVVGIAKQLKNVTIRRRLHETGQKLIKATEKDEGKKAGELIAQATEIFNGQVNLLGGNEDDEPQDLYKTMDQFIDQQSSYDTRSLATPFSLFNDMYGYMDPGNLYVAAARAKTGKSTWIMSMLHQLAKADGDTQQFRGLLLDTELTREEVQSRLLSSMTGIKEFYIRHKLYRKNRAMRELVEQAREELVPLWNHVDHIFIGGKGLDEQLSIARRWTHKHIIRTGRRGMLALDYFKYNSRSDFSSKTSRDLIVGGQADAYKNLAKELEIPVWALIQAGRQNEDTKEGQKVENGSVIADSDIVARVGSNIFLLQKLSPEERAQFGQEGPDGATHSLKNIYPRQLGPNEQGKEGALVRYSAMGAHGKQVTRTVENFLLYSFKSFHVREIGSLKDVVDRMQSRPTQIQPATTEIERPLL